MNFADFKIELSEKDGKIVKDNPNASIDTLMEKGLSAQGTKKLMEFQGSVKQFKPNRRELKPTSVSQNQNANGNQNWARPVHNRRTGQTINMSPKAASRVLGKLNVNREMGSGYGKNYSAS